ncbi:MAG: CoA transferase subunit A [Promethearchaeota archaeon]
MSLSSSKIMTMKDAVFKFVNDGDMIVSANFLHGTPYAIVHEIVRQQKKNLTAVSCSSIEELDLMLSGGCLSKIITSYYHRAGGKVYNRELDRALKDKSVEYEDYTNFTMYSMLKAGACGFTFMPTLKSVMESDVFRIRTHVGENKFKVINCPFTGNETVLVPALNPDVAIVHVQRCDQFGNAQFWGSMGTIKWSVLSAKKIIVSCEEIVDHEIIKRSPFLTLVPGFRVNAIVEEPWGAHPSCLAGYYNVDINWRSVYFAYALTQNSNEAFLNEWLYDRIDRKDYIDHYISRYGKEPLDLLKVNEYKSDTINIGYKKLYWQDGICTKLGLNREQYNELAEKYGELELYNE